MSDCIYSVTERPDTEPLDILNAFKLRVNLLEKIALNPKDRLGLSIWSTSQILAHKTPPGHSLLGEGYLERGEITVIVGQGGIGKSRLVTHLAFCQITGRDWCGITPGGDPAVWLMIGNENSIVRLQNDLDTMLRNYSEAERKLIEQKFKLQVPMNMEDYALNFKEDQSKQNFLSTLEIYKPDVLVIDPFANYVLGDENHNTEVIETIRTIRNLVKSVVPNCAILFIHHARTGKANINQGVGYDKANFGRGGKGLYSACRCQINLMPGDENDHTKLVLSCGKSNNCAPFETRGLNFNPNSYDYTLNPDFKLTEWLEKLQYKGNSHVCSIEDVTDAVREGNTKTSDILHYVEDCTLASRPTIKRRLKEAIDKGFLEKTGVQGQYKIRSITQSGSDCINDTF